MSAYPRLSTFLATGVLLSFIAISPAAAADGGLSFRDSLEKVNQIAACGVPLESQDPKLQRIVARYCRKLHKTMESFKSGWLPKASAFFQEKVPSATPDNILYPFGGSDLVTLLAVFPNATTYTSISLEASGDPRGVHKLNNTELKTELEFLHKKIHQHLRFAHSRTQNLLKLSRAQLTAELVFNLVALKIHDYQPVDLRYFNIQEDGSLRYMTQADLDELEADGKRISKRENRRQFRNMELTFRRVGVPQGKLQTFRHIATNLADSHLKSNPGFMRYIASQGSVATIFKAASFLIPQDSFSTLRNALLSQAELIVADSTGVLPEQAIAAGFTQETYGEYKGAFLRMGRWTNKHFVPLWENQPHRPLNFRFGYPDNSRHHHLVITRKASPPTP